MIYYLSPGSPNEISGGTRKLYDHVAILNQRGLEARIVTPDDIMRGLFFDMDRDVIVVPEVFGDGVRDFVPRGWRRIVFVQNSYLTDRVDGLQIVVDANNHPYLTCPELVAVFTESDHTTQRLRWRFPDLKIPLIRTHSSGNGRNGQPAGFEYGPWPREHRIMYFGYKHEADNKAVLDGLKLPDGWEAESLTGLTDQEIAVRLRSGAIFLATNRDEGMCAPTSEAMISGPVIVCWTGHGPDEYLVDRSVIVAQDDVEALRNALVSTATDITHRPKFWGARTREWSEWFCDTYSRDRECDEIVDIFECLL